MKLINLITLLSLLSISGLSAEADHYTGADRALIDVAELVQIRANQYLSKALETLNQKSDCNYSEDSELALYSELRNYFANHSHGQLVKDILHSKDFPTRVTPKTESIYSEWAINDGFLLGRPGSSKSQLGLMPLMKIGKHEIGVDKLEHMFGMGLIYYKNHYLKQKHLHQVLKGGIFREKTVLGGNLIATGVFSYADLAANFNGFRFWNHVLQKHDDVLGPSYNQGPYVKCDNGKWKTTENKIDFRNYVDESMDETINCRKLATKGGLKKSKQAMFDRGFNPAGCPRSLDILNLMSTKYDVSIPTDPEGRSISHWIINRKGLGIINYFGEFKDR